MRRPLRQLVCGLVLTIVSGCAEQNVYEKPPPPQVKVARPLQQTVTSYLEETATTEAVGRVDVRARVEGFLQTVNFEPGTMVKEGDPLYQIEPEIYEARVAAAEATLLAAQAQRKQAQIEKDRQERVQSRDAGATSESAVVAAQATYESADAAVKAAEARLKQARIDRSYTKVTSPLTGRVGKTLVKEGNLVGEGVATVLTTVIQYAPIYANFNISERSLLQLREQNRAADDMDLGSDGEGDPAKSSSVQKMPHIPMFLKRMNDKDFRFQGTVEYADLAVDQSTGTFMMRGLFSNEDLEILPGLFVQIRIPIGKIEDALLVPERSTAADQAGRYVLVVNKESNQVERRNIVQGTKVGDMIVVEEGITADDLVIIEGLQRSRPGVEVKPEPIVLTNDSASTEAVQSDGTLPPTSTDVPAGASSDQDSVDAGDETSSGGLLEITSSDSAE